MKYFASFPAKKAFQTIQLKASSREEAKAAITSIQQFAKIREYHLTEEGGKDHSVVFFVFPAPKRNPV